MEVQHEGIGIPSQLCHNEGHALSHSAQETKRTRRRRESASVEGLHNHAATRGVASAPSRISMSPARARNEM